METLTTLFVVLVLGHAAYTDYQKGVIRDWHWTSIGTAAFLYHVQWSLHIHTWMPLVVMALVMIPMLLTGAILQYYDKWRGGDTLILATVLGMMWTDIATFLTILAIISVLWVGYFDRVRAEPVRYVPVILFAYLLSTVVAA